VITTVRVRCRYRCRRRSRRIRRICRAQVRRSSSCRGGRGVGRLGRRLGRRGQRRHVHNPERSSYDRRAARQRTDGHATSTVHAPVTDVTARRGRARGLGARGSNAGGRVRCHGDDIVIILCFLRRAAVEWGSRALV